MAKCLHLLILGYGYKGTYYMIFYFFHINFFKKKFKKRKNIKNE